MNVIVLGGSGMLGSMIADVLSRDPEINVSATVRNQALADRSCRVLPEVEWRVLDCTADRDTIQKAITGARWIINAIGITKPYVHDEDPAEVENAIRINSLFPHELALCAQASGARVIQIATDCVYSGHTGSYCETDLHDPLDVYGKTKSLGEVLYPGTHCLRCSIIGPEPKSYVFLLNGSAAAERRRIKWLRQSSMERHNHSAFCALMRRCHQVRDSQCHDCSMLSRVEPYLKYELLKIFATDYGVTIYE